MKVTRAGFEPATLGFCEVTLSMTTGKNMTGENGGLGVCRYHRRRFQDEVTQSLTAPELF